MLASTSVIVEQAGVIPGSEREVRDAMFRHLKIVFPDIQRDVSIIKATKVYKPDFAIRELKAGIEYKFAATESEARNLLGGIYEDIHGYAGSEDWTEFYAVLYLGGPFLTQHQVEAEWNISDPSKHWHPILVFGAGARKPRRSPRRATTPRTP
jgi:hypothetical protein